MWLSKANPNPNPSSVEEVKDELMRLKFLFYEGFSERRIQVVKASRRQLFTSEEKGLALVAGALHQIEVDEEDNLPDGILEDSRIANYIYNCILVLPKVVKAVHVLFVYTDRQFKVKCGWVTPRVVRQLDEDDEIEQQDIQCPVCLEDLVIGDLVAYLYCKHAFHRKCLYDWVEVNCGFGSCPLCRLPFTDSFDYLDLGLAYHHDHESMTTASANIQAQSGLQSLIQEDD